MTEPRLLPYGPEAMLAEYSSIEEVIAVTARISDAAPLGVVDVVPAARTVLVTLGPSADREVVRSLLVTPCTERQTPSSDATVEIDVVYDGPDLSDVAARCQLSVEEVVSRHCAASYTVAFCGFMPGFAYLVGLDERLVLPRRSTPRPRVDAGSVAIASEFSAVYPTASPGGWHLLGRCDAVLWDDSRDVPALLPPGTIVRFVAR